MKSTTAKFKIEFVTNAPDLLEPGVLYISIPYTMVLHKCPCGCGGDVATKISPKRWTLIFDGERISLDPSIRNTGMPCKSHYFIRKNEVKWAFDREYHVDSKPRKRKKRFWLF